MSSKNKGKNQPAKNQTMSKIPATKEQASTNHKEAAEVKTAAAPAAEAKAEVEKAPKEPKAPGKIASILALFLEGKSNKDIEEAGFHKTTIAIQVAKFKKKCEEAFGKTDAEIKELGLDPVVVKRIHGEKVASDKAKAEKAEKAKKEPKPAEKAAA